MGKNHDRKIALHSVSYVYDENAAKEWADVFIEMIREKMVQAYSAPHTDKHIFKKKRRDCNE